MTRFRRVAAVIALVLAGAGSASAQVDFSGEWAPRFWEDNPERVPGPELGEFAGIPISEAARLRAEAWDASIQTLPEWQCRPHSADYIWRGPSPLRISKEVDPVSREIVAFHAEWMRSVDRAVYLDGRPHPADGALHTWAGFSTAKWDGDMLTVTVTHLKEGYLRRNGLPRSDQATLTEHWIRNGDFLTIMTIINDPVYLTEPFVRTTDYELNLAQQVVAYPCGVVQEVDRARGQVPAFAPGENPYMTEHAVRHKLPLLATQGGAETMYPDFRAKMAAQPAARPTDRRPPIGTVPVSAVPVSTVAVNTVPATSGAVPAAAGSAVRVLPVRGPLYVLQAGGVNMTVSAGRDGVLIVDAGPARVTAEAIEAIRGLQRQLEVRDQPMGFGAETRSSVAGRNVQAPPKPIRYVINTQSHADHTGGNARLRAAGRTFTGGNVANDIRDSTQGAAILAHENVQVRLARTAAGQPAAPLEAQPTDTYYTESMKLSHFFNGEGVVLLHQPAAASDGDSMVWFRGSDVIAAGDIFDTTGYPMIDTARGGTIDGVLEGLNRILDLAVAEFRTEGGTLIIPGHGRISDSADVAYYRDMVTIIRDRVQAMKAKGMTPAQVKAARPTADYDPRYGSTRGAWTTDMFVDAVYATVGAK